MLCDLLCGLLRVDPAKRLSADQALKLEFFNKDWLDFEIKLATHQHCCSKPTVKAESSNRADAGTNVAMEQEASPVKQENAAAAAVVKQELSSVRQSPRSATKRARETSASQRLSK